MDSNVSSLLKYPLNVYWFRSLTWYINLTPYQRSIWRVTTSIFSLLKHEHPSSKPITRSRLTSVHLIYELAHPNRPVSQVAKMTFRVVSAKGSTATFPVKKRGINIRFILIRLYIEWRSQYPRPDLVRLDNKKDVPHPALPPKKASRPTSPVVPLSRNTGYSNSLSEFNQIRVPSSHINRIKPSRGK